MNTRKQLRHHFRNWWNDYLTIETYAEHYGWTDEYCNRVINTGRKLHNRKAEELTKLLKEELSNV